MKIQIISRDDISEGLVYDLWKENNIIYYKGKNKYVFNNMNVMKVNEYKKDVDYYIFDDTLFGIQIEKMREEGKNVVGGNKIGDKLELDRWFFYKTAQRLGLKIPLSKRFSRISDGIAFVEENGGRWVFKPSGKWSDEKSLTFVGKDVLNFMRELKEKEGDNHEFILQRYVDGIEVAITGLVVDGKVVGGYFINFEFKPFMKYSTLNTGEMGTIVKWVERIPILSDYLDKFAKELGVYRGWFDLNGILAEDGWYLLESTSRMGIPIMSILHSMIDENIGEFYKSVADGSIDGFKVKKDWAVGLVLAVPPFPYHIENAWEMSQYPIKNGLFEDRDVHYYEIMKKDDSFWTSGDSGFVGVIVGFGEDWKKASDMAVEKARKIEIPNKFFRSDFGEDERPKRFIEKFKYDESMGDIIGD